MSGWQQMIFAAIFSSSVLAAYITARAQRKKVAGDAAKSATEAAATVVDILRAEVEKIPHLQQELEALRGEVSTLKARLTQETGQVERLKRYVAVLVRFIRDAGMDPPPEESYPPLSYREDVAP